MTLPTTARNATLADLAAMLKDQQARKYDVVASASRLAWRDGHLVLRDSQPVITEDGVTTVDGLYRPTDVFIQNLALKLDLPLPYLRRLRESREDLMAANVNGWLRPQDTGYDPETRKFLLRTFTNPDSDEPGVARALLSDSYKVMDHFDVLTAALQGVRDSGVQVEVGKCDLTDRRMMVRVHAPAVQALAPTLLKGYRSPFTGESGADNPVVFAGFVLTNSETGWGSFSLTPEITVRICSNGMTMTKDVLRKVHLGTKMDEGVIRWSEDTMEKNLALVTAQARDAVATFLDKDYVEAKVRELEAKSGAPVDNVDDVKAITKRLRFTDEETDGVLGMFIRGGQMTAGGIVQAVTAYTQTIQDADRAFDLNGEAVKVLDLV
jgi:hypothetical protein